MSVLRRLVVASLTFAVVAPAICSALAPQTVFRLAHLSTAGRTADGGPPKALREGLDALGYVEGRNILYEARFAEGRVEQLPALAREVVGLRPDVIVAQGRPAVVAALQATSTIPIVIAPASSDAVATGLIASLARPGNNVTGLSDELDLLSAKRVELLREAVPGMNRLAVVWNANDPGMLRRYRAIESAAQALHVEVDSHALRSVEDFETAFSAMSAHRPDALFLVTDALTTMNENRVVEFSAKHRIPAMYESNAVVRQGGLMSYGPKGEDMFRRAAAYVDRILKGAKPAELPAEQPMTYSLSVNLRTAAALGLTMPQLVLVRADEILR